jgi:hypothetical protein
LRGGIRPASRLRTLNSNITSSLAPCRGELTGAGRRATIARNSRSRVLMPMPGRRRARMAG